MKHAKLDNNLRPLGIFERALALYDRKSPFNVVSVLRLENAPSPETVQRALDVLQNRHPLLKAGIENNKFIKLLNPIIQFQVSKSQNDADWLEIVEQELNKRLDPPNGLLRGNYIQHLSSTTSELILTIHHAIMDAVSGMTLLDELLQLCTKSDLTKESQAEILPPVEDRFPPAFKDLRGSIQTAKYVMAQMVEGLSFQWHALGKRKPVFNKNSRGFPMILTLPEALVDDLSKQCRARKVTLNSLLNAVIVLAASRLLYAGDSRPMQTFSFADLRPYTIPPTPPDQLANYISMLRYTVSVSGQMDIWSLAIDLHAKIYKSLKSGSKFTASKVSESLIRMFIGLEKIRMGNTALNYCGAVSIKPIYGDIKVLDVRGFLSTAHIGPEVAAQARLFNNELQIDFMFLKTDMDRDMAEKIVEEVKAVLEQAAMRTV